MLKDIEIQKVLIVKEKIVRLLFSKVSVLGSRSGSSKLVLEYLISISGDSANI